MRVEMIIDGDFYEIKNKIVEMFPNLIRLSFDGAEQDKWVSVEDRLPQKGEDVLLYGKKYGVVTGIYNKLFDGWYVEDSVCDGAVYFKQCFTHWQPLPEPPKGE